MSLFRFNFYSALLLPAVIQCLLFAALCCRRFLKNGGRSDAFLALLLLFTGLKLSFWMLGFAGWYDRHDALTSLMFYFPFNSYLISGPVVYFYFRSLVDTDFRISREEWPHLILPAAFLLLIAGKLVLDYTFYYPFPNQPDNQFGTRGPFAEADKSELVSLIGFISFFFYLWLVLKSFPAYRKYVRENFSDTDLFDFDWLKQMLLALFVGVAILFVFNLYEQLTGGISYRADWYSYFALAILSYYISINGYFLPVKQLRKLHFAPVKQSVQKSDPPDEELRRRLEALMISAKPYLEPDLSLAELASLLKTGKSALSKTINSCYQQNFNDYINRYRVEALIELLKQGKHRELTLLGLAFDCGFNSKATFNRAFKNATGLSPKAYMEQLNRSQSII